MFEGSDIVIALVLSGISVILSVAEYLVNKFRALFMVADAVFLAASAIAIIIRGGAMCDLLLVIVITICVRLFFEIRAGRKEK